MATGLRPILAAAAILLSVGAPGGSGDAQSPAPSAGSAGHHGTPRGWKFAWPGGGNIARGRELFAKLECYSCHEVRGESYPAPTDAGRLGPELSAMGPLHDADYFAESIINPGAAIEKGRNYAGPDGSSRMPSFNDSLTVQDVTDLVAYLRQLRPPARGPAGRATPGGHRHH
jgi:mono/diheme cytochrome c family protein